MMKAIFICMLPCLLCWSAPYSGPKDERVVTRDEDIMFGTTMGQLAKLSSSAGIGRVVQKGKYDNPNNKHFRGYFKVRVSRPFFGCERNELITILEPRVDPHECIANAWMPDDEYEDYLTSFGFDVFPTNHGHIVFAVTTNCYGWNTFGTLGWDPGLERIRPFWTTKTPFLNYETRSWWYTDYQGGLPLAHFLNVVRTMRTHRDWTHYYKICRNAAASPSVRVREDSFHDLRYLMYRATKEQLQYIENDPLKTPDCITYIPHVRRVRQEREERNRQKENQ